MIQTGFYQEKRNFTRCRVCIKVFYRIKWENSERDSEPYLFTIRSICRYALSWSFNPIYRLSLKNRMHFPRDSLC